MLAGVTAIAVLSIIAVAIVSREQLQAERANSLRTGCEQTNQRNVATKRIVDQRFPDSEGREITLLPIDALAPHRDCDALINERVGR
ncbi:MAG: hypothetical protein Q8O56_06145 [Solirubrobacteraceae bacterium]|nr:hypothetical protein [Solirubrobacteraceae bacterium]